MKMRQRTYLILAMALLGGMFYFTGCTHDDEMITSSGANIERGDLQLKLDPATNPNLIFEKSHSNVGWETPYAGSLSLLTGRFNEFGFNSFNFDESTASGISFETWVRLNTVNTGEPGRDQGCLLGTYGTAKIGEIAPDDPTNLAIFKSTSVKLSTTDAGYFVTGDLTFHGATKSITGKLMYDGMVDQGAKIKYGFSFEFQILAQTDFLITSTSIADAVNIKCNAIFTYTK